MREIRRLRPPDRLTGRAQPLIATLMEADTLRDARPTADAQRAIELHEMRLRANELRNALAADASSPDEIRYCETLAELSADGARELELWMRESARALSELIAHLESLRPPSRLRWRHDALCRAWRDEFVAMSAYHAHASGSDVEAARDAFAGYAEAVEVRSGRLRALGFYELKPSR